MDCSLPGSSVHGIFQSSILEWDVVSSFKPSSWPRDQTCISCVSCTGSKFFTIEPPGKPVKVKWPAVNHSTSENQSFSWIQVVWFQSPDFEENTSRHSSGPKILRSMYLILGSTSSVSWQNEGTRWNHSHVPGFAFSLLSNKMAPSNPSLFFWIFLFSLKKFLLHTVALQYC